MLEESGQFRAKDEMSGPGGIIEWLFAETIAAAEESGVLSVVHRKSPHAIESLRKPSAPFAVAVQKDFAVGMVGLEAMSARF
jgi:hypothetical protein